MHASLDQLLKLRDDAAADETAAAHVATCLACANQLAQLRAVTRGLRTLQAPWAVPDRWNEVRSALRQVRPATPRARPGWLLPAASVAAVAALAVALTIRQDISPTVSPSAPQTAALEGPVNLSPVQVDSRDLIAESRRLEDFLSTLPQEPRVTRVGTALTVAGLEDRIQWVDDRLTLGAEEGLNRQQAERLWRERVELLNSLVAV